MAGVKTLSQILLASSLLTPTDTLIGVQSGALDRQFTLNQLISSINIAGLPSATTSPNFVPVDGQIEVWVDPSGNDNNSGNQANPFLTLQHALNYCAQWNYLNIYNPQITVNNGTYTIAAAVVFPELTNSLVGGIVVCNPSSPSSVVFDGSGMALGNPLFIGTGSGAQWQIDGFEGNVSGPIFRPQFLAGFSIQNGVNINDTNNSGLTYLANIQSTGGFSCVSFSGTVPINVLISTLAGLLQVQDYSGAIFQDAAVTLQPSTVFNNGIFLASSYSSINTFNCTYVNGASVSGGASITDYSFIRTANGLFSDVPGGIFFDATSSMGGRDIVPYFTAIGENNAPAGGEAAKVSSSWQVQENLTFNNIVSLAVNAGDSVIPNVQVKLVCRVPNQQTSNYTLRLGDQDGRVEMNDAGANTVTVPPFGHRGTIVGGATYTNGTYTRVPLTGGSGTGAVATIVVSGNVVSSVTVTYSGVGYALSDVLSASASNIGGTGSGFTFTLTTLGVSFPVGTEIRVVQTGVGATTPTAGTGVTGSNFGAVGGQWKSVVLYQSAQDHWVQTNV